MQAWAAVMESFVAVPPASVQLILKDHFPRVSRQSCLSANYKSDNEMIPGAAHGSPGIYLRTEENSENPKLGDRLMKALRPVIASNGIP